MATSTQTYEFRLNCWNGVPANDLYALDGYSMYPYLDRAWWSLGHTEDCFDRSNRPDMMRMIVSRIEPDQHGIWPSIDVVPQED